MYLNGEGTAALGTEDSEDVRGRRGGGEYDEVGREDQTVEELLPAGFDD